MLKPGGKLVIAGTSKAIHPSTNLSYASYRVLIIEVGNQNPRVKTGFECLTCSMPFLQLLSAFVPVFGERLTHLEDHEVLAHQRSKKFHILKGPGVQ